MDISEIDQNYKNIFRSAGMTTYSVNEPPFALYGLCREPGEQDFKRLLHRFAQTLKNDTLRLLYRNTAGLRVRFRTDSRRVLLKCELPEVCSTADMALAGSSCFDLYADGSYVNVLLPGLDLDGYHAENRMGKHGYSSGYEFPDSRMREILIHFPLYNDVSAVYIGLDEGAQLLPASPYAHQKPVVFYGSSITQGGCASHPGNCYSAMLSRRLDTDFINLGFSGACRAEPEMAEYISGLDMRVFVYDYDHNAPDADFLEQTHQPFFEIVRKKQPELPVILVSAADDYFPDCLRRRDIIRRTYERAVAAGDRNVYFVDGRTIYRDVGRSNCLVDVAHPNDLGFWCMANAIEPVLAPLLR